MSQDLELGVATSVDRSSDRRVEPLAGNRDFKVLLVGQGISAVGDAVSFTALPLLVLALTGSGLAMGMVGVLQSIPDLLFGMVAGVLADRHDRRRMMLLADLGRAGLTALIPLSYLLGLPTIAVVFLVAAPMTLLRSMFMASYIASLPNLVGRPQLGRANSILEVISSFGFVIGPAIAGVMVATVGAARTIAIDAASYAVSAAALFFIRRPLTLVRDHPPRDLIREVRDGAAYVYSHRPLRDTVAFWGTVTGISAGIVPALAYFVIAEEALDAAALGLVLGAYGLGTFAGAIVTTRLRFHKAGRLMLGGNAVRGVSAISVVAIGTVPAMMAASLAFGFVESVVLIDLHHATGGLLAGRADRAGRRNRPDVLTRPILDRVRRRRVVDRCRGRSCDAGRDRPGHGRHQRVVPALPPTSPRRCRGSLSQAATGTASVIDPVIGAGSSRTTTLQAEQVDPSASSCSVTRIGSAHHGQSIWTMALAALLREGSYRFMAALSPGSVTAWVSSPEGTWVRGVDGPYSPWCGALGCGKVRASWMHRPWAGSYGLG